ncbi:MAG: CPBP family intramembrane metalloprotease [Deltaproteobacteria bacterium]|nr:CPBP family intramembrane metalloprotease [Deltaproteobacteria bacterium]
MPPGAGKKYPECDRILLAKPRVDAENTSQATQGHAQSMPNTPGVCFHPVSLPLVRYAMPRPSHSRLVTFALLFYLPMMASGVIAVSPGTLWIPSPSGMLTGVGLALAGAWLVVALSRQVTRSTPWGRRLRLEFRTLLQGVDSRQILLLALGSSLGEEILFRGVLHPRLGLWVTALMFGAMHLPPRLALWPWTFFALVMGVALGLLTDYSQTLWPAIVLHFIINYFNLHHIVEPDPGEPPGG